MKEITHDFNHHLTFYCTHNQLCVPQYKVNRVLGIYNFGQTVKLNFTDQDSPWFLKRPKSKGAGNLAIRSQEQNPFLIEFVSEAG